MTTSPPCPKDKDYAAAQATATVGSKGSAPMLKAVEMAERLFEYSFETKANAGFVYDLIMHWCTQIGLFVEKNTPHHLARLNAKSKGNVPKSESATLRKLLLNQSPVYWWLFIDEHLAKCQSESGALSRDCASLSVTDLSENVLLCAERNERVKAQLLEALLNVASNGSFSPINKNAWCLALIAILDTPLLKNLSHSIVLWLAKEINRQHRTRSFLNKDELRYVVMFLRPELVEKCARLVQRHGEAFESAFKRLADALVDDYKPFRRWLFCRLCSTSKRLVGKTMAMYILFGPSMASATTAAASISSHITSPSLLRGTDTVVIGSGSMQSGKSGAIPLPAPLSADTTKLVTAGPLKDPAIVATGDVIPAQSGTAESSTVTTATTATTTVPQMQSQVNLQRLITAFRFCMIQSNELTIHNESRAAFELGHLLLNELICVCETLRKFLPEPCFRMIDNTLARMYCNEATIFLSLQRLDEALYSANHALFLDRDCRQAHRVRADIHLRRSDFNTALDDLEEILNQDGDHPYASQAQRDIHDLFPSLDFFVEEVGHSPTDSSDHKPVCTLGAALPKAKVSTAIPCPRERHSATNLSKNNLLIFGGVAYNATSKDKPLNDAWFFETCHRTWNKLETPNPPMGRHSHTSVIVGHHLYLIGGSDKVDCGESDYCCTAKVLRFSKKKRHKLDINLTVDRILNPATWRVTASRRWMYRDLNQGFTQSVKVKSLAKGAKTVYFHDSTGTRIIRLESHSPLSGLRQLIRNWHILLPHFLTGTSAASAPPLDVKRTDSADISRPSMEDEESEPKGEEQPTSMFERVRRWFEGYNSATVYPESSASTAKDSTVSPEPSGFDRLVETVRREQESKAAAAVAATGTPKPKAKAPTKESGSSSAPVPGADDYSATVDKASAATRRRRRRRFSLENIDASVKVAFVVCYFDNEWREQIPEMELSARRWISSVKGSTTIASALGGRRQTGESDSVADVREVKLGVVVAERGTAAVASHGSEVSVSTSGSGELAAEESSEFDIECNESDDDKEADDDDSEFDSDSECDLCDDYQYYDYQYYDEEVAAGSGERVPTAGSGQKYRRVDAPRAKHNSLSGVLLPDDFRDAESRIMHTATGKKATVATLKEEHKYRADFPSVEICDLKNNRWIHPQIKGIGPPSVMQNHRSVMLDRNVYVFPTVSSFPHMYYTVPVLNKRGAPTTGRSAAGGSGVHPSAGCVPPTGVRGAVDGVLSEDCSSKGAFVGGGDVVDDDRMRVVYRYKMKRRLPVLYCYVFHVDTLVWETFNIPETHRPFVTSEMCVPVQYSRDKIAFVAPFAKDLQLNCVLFTKSMTWSPVRKVPTTQLSGYRRMMHYAHACFNSYVIVHGGVLQRDQYSNALQSASSSRSLLQMPVPSLLGYNTLVRANSKVQASAGRGKRHSISIDDGSATRKRQSPESASADESEAVTKAIASQKLREAVGGVLKKASQKLKEKSAKESSADCMQLADGRVMKGKDLTAVTRTFEMHIGDGLSFVDELLTSSEMNSMFSEIKEQLSLLSLEQLIDCIEDGSPLVEEVKVAMGSSQVALDIANLVTAAASAALENGDNESEDDTILDDFKESSADEHGADGKVEVDGSDSFGDGGDAVFTTADADAADACGDALGDDNIVYERKLGALWPQAMAGTRLAAAFTDSHVPQLHALLRGEYCPTQADMYYVRNAWKAPASDCESMSPVSDGLLTQRDTIGIAKELRALRCGDLDSEYFAHYSPLFLSNLEFFDAVRMKWLPRPNLVLHLAERSRQREERRAKDSPATTQPLSGSVTIVPAVDFDSDCGNSDAQFQEYILHSPRIRHTVTIVGNDLLIFGGSATSHLIILPGFVPTLDRVSTDWNTRLLTMKPKGKRKPKAAATGSEVVESDYDTCVDSLLRREFGVDWTETTQPPEASVYGSMDGSFHMAQCANCLILELRQLNFRTCSQCKLVQYCSRDCQRQHWKMRHRHVCQKLSSQKQTRPS